MIEAFDFALSVLIENWHLALIASVFGMAMGINPGMGGSVGIALAVPFTIGTVDTGTAFLIYGCILGATSFAGSVSAILANVPGGGSNAATLLDGYPLARDGKGGLAISAAAYSSAFGAIVGLGVFILLLPFVMEIALLFGPSEMFWVVVVGLAIIPLVAGDRKLIGFGMAAFGLFLGLYGTSLATGETRYTYGYPDLVDGIGLIPMIIGMFAFAELIRLAVQNEGKIAKTDPAEVGGGRIDGLKELVKHRMVWFRGSIIGVLIGAVPGAGGTVATFVSYGQAVASSANPSSFGKGNIAGVIAAESANDAKDGGQLFPTFGLGIPGSSSTAVLLGVFIGHGILPGPSLLTEHLELMVTVVVGLLAANIISSTVGLLTVNQLVLVTKLRTEYLYPSIILIGLFSVFFLRNSGFDMVLAVIFGLFGYVLLVFGISRVPVVIAFVLGIIMENNYWLAVQLGDGIIDSFFTGWLNILLVLLFVAILAFGVKQTFGDQGSSMEITDQVKND